MSCSKCMSIKDAVFTGLIMLLPLLAFTQNSYRTNPCACNTGYPVYASHTSLIRPVTNTASSVDFYHFSRYRTTSENGSCNVDVTFDDKRLTISVDDVPVHYDVIYIERSPGRDKIVKIITYAEPVKGEKVRPRYRWYYVPDKDKFVCSDTGISFSN